MQQLGALGSHLGVELGVPGAEQGVGDVQALPIPAARRKGSGRGGKGGGPEGKPRGREVGVAAAASSPNVNCWTQAINFGVIGLTIIDGESLEWRVQTGRVATDERLTVWARRLLRGWVGKACPRLHVKRTRGLTMQAANTLRAGGWRNLHLP